MKRRGIFYWTVLFVLLFGLGLTACGGSEPPPPTAAPTSTPAPPTATPTPAPPTPTPTPSASDHIERGKEYLDQEEPDEAIAEFQAAVELEPDNAIAHNELGVAYGEQGRFDEALAELKEAIRLKPDYAIAHANLCLVYVEQDKLDEAIAECEEALKLDPNYADAHNNLGWAYAKQDKLDEAIAEFEEAIRLDPDHFWAHNNLGSMYSKQGKFDEAIVELKEAIRINPDRAVAHYNLGLAYARQEEYDEAITEYEETLRLEPDHAGAHLDLGVIYRELGMPDKAIVEFETYLQLRPDASNRAAVEAEIAKLRKPTIESLLVSPPAPDVAADFTTYQNPTLGLSFQYPADWHIDEQANNSVVVASHPDLFDGLDAGETGVQVRINATTLQEWGVSGPMEGINRFVVGMSQDAILDGPAEIQINGQQAVAVLLRMETADVPQSSIMAVIENGDHLAVAAATVSLEMEAQLFPTMASIITSIEVAGAEEEAELPPGNSIKFSDTLKGGAEDGFFFLGSSGSTVLASIEPEAGLDVIVELQDGQTGDVLVTVNESSGPESLIYQIPADGGLLYKIVVRGVDGAGGKYDASFIGSVGIGFDLWPSYFVAGRLPEGKSLSYTYTGAADSTLHGLIIPHPDTPIDLIVKIYSVTDLKTVLLEVNDTGPGENEEFAFALPKNDVYFITVEDVDGNAGKYLLAIEIQ